MMLSPWRDDRDPCWHWPWMEPQSCQSPRKIHWALCRPWCMLPCRLGMAIMALALGRRLSHPCSRLTAVTSLLPHRGFRTQRRPWMISGNQLLSSGELWRSSWRELRRQARRLWPLAPRCFRSTGRCDDSPSACSWPCRLTLRRAPTLKQQLQLALRRQSTVKKSLIRLRLRRSTVKKSRIRLWLRHRRSLRHWLMRRRSWIFKGRMMWCRMGWRRSMRPGWMTRRRSVRQISSSPRNLSQRRDS
mmetsp:Transcript_16978/g.37287  ORF Transcript_16978/g.37287 Transcript_16978/m.37287 type:complete len:245 (+) Transcript_16978:268-1002(+)